LRTQSRLGHRKTFLAVCWLMVEPPRSFLPALVGGHGLLDGPEVEALVLAEPGVLGGDTARDQGGEIWRMGTHRRSKPRPSKTRWTISQVTAGGTNG
jgi:hypothetical protein